MSKLKYSRAIIVTDYDSRIILAAITYDFFTFAFDLSPLRAYF